MILVPITVMDPTDKPVENLAPTAFRVFEDDVEQRIVSLSKEEGPVSVGFIFDTSSSMKNRMDKSVAAIEQFLKTNMPGDEYFLVRFADKPTVVTGFTLDPNDILRELAAIQPQGWTASARCHLSRRAADETRQELQACAFCAHRRWR